MFGSLIQACSRSPLPYLNTALPPLVLPPATGCCLPLAITLLLWSQATLMPPCSDRVDWLNKQQQKDILLLGDRCLPDVALVGGGK